MFYDGPGEKDGVIRGYMIRCNQDRTAVRNVIAPLDNKSVQKGCVESYKIHGKCNPTALQQRCLHYVPLPEQDFITYGALIAQWDISGNSAPVQRKFP